MQLIHFLYIFLFSPIIIISRFFLNDVTHHFLMIKYLEVEVNPKVNKIVRIKNTNTHEKLFLMIFKLWFFFSYNKNTKETHINRGEGEISMLMWWKRRLWMTIEFLWSNLTFVILEGFLHSLFLYHYEMMSHIIRKKSGNDYYGRK